MVATPDSAVKVVVGTAMGVMGEIGWALRVGVAAGDGAAVAVGIDLVGALMVAGGASPPQAVTTMQATNIQNRFIWTSIYAKIKRK